MARHSEDTSRLDCVNRRKNVTKMTTRRELICRGVCLLLCCLCALRCEENSSFGKPAMQSSNYYSSNWTAEKAVDGCLIQNVRLGCCVHTAAGRKKVWWQVDLGELSTISDITIYYRDEDSVNTRQKFAGYQLFLSNTSAWSQGFLCHEDKSSNWTEVDLLVTHQCPDVARFVTIYNYRNDPMRHDWYHRESLLELCEVQVFGCPVGKYGHGNCNQTCSDKCYGGNCDASTGSCLYCLPGKWGYDCEQDCSSNCKSCFQNGSCTDCVSGKWGETCNRDCSRNCNDCFQNNGSCIDCVDGKYGNSCKLFCPTHCANNICDRDFGLCVECDPGKRGGMCDLDCSTRCKDLFCEKDTGICSECVDGTYGYKCENTCPGGCDSNKCRRSDGRCEVTDTHEDNKAIVSVLAAVAGLFMVTSILAFVYMLRIRTALKKEQEKASVAEDHYEGIDIAARDGPHANYEMASSNRITN